MSSDNITSAEVGGNAATSDLIGLEGGAGHTEDVGSHAGTLDLTGGDAEMTTANIPDSSRSYSGPTVYQNRWTILCGFTLLVGVGVAIGLSVNSLERSNEALELALEGVKELQETNKAVIDAVEEMEDWEQRPAPAVPAASIGPPPATPEPTSKPTPPAPNTPPPSYAPSESHPLNPKWYHISHKQYQESLASHAAQNMTIQNGKMKPWVLKNILCQRQSLDPCDYDAYCPNGAGGKPFHGGPPQTEGWEGRKREQWSPLLGEGTKRGTFPWVQVGYVPEEDGGKDGSQCVMWDDFAYGNGADILEVRGEPYMEWMLCCEKPEQSTIFDPEGGGER